MNFLTTKQILTAQSLGASFTGAAREVLTNPYNVELVWTGTVAGTLNIEETAGGTLWTKVGSDITVTNAGNTSVTVEVPKLTRAIRIVWTRTSGTGSIDAYLTIQTSE